MPDAAPPPAMLTISPGPTAFGDVVLGQASSPVTYTVTNSGELPSGTVGALLDSTTAGFALANNSCSGVTLQPHGTCSFDVGFTPVAAGAAMTTVRVSATPGGDVTADLTGNGLEPGALDIVETGHDFTTLAVDATPKTHTFVVTNTGQVPTGMPTAQITGTVASYAVMSTTCNSMLAPAATCNVVVKFDPSTVGSKPGSLVVTAQPGGSDSATLSGIGNAHVAVTKTGNGTGMVTSNITGINCGSACAADFSATPVTLTAVPDTGMTFAGWTGDCTGTSPCTLDLTAGKTVAANLTKQRFALTTGTTGNGQGTLTLSPAGGTYDYGQMVTVTATPATSSTFDGFGGDCSGTTCTVTMTQAHNVTASFTLKRFTLTTSTTGTGGGTVTGAGTYDYGQPVTVTNSPDVGSTFAGWGGDCSGTTTCTVTMTANHNVSATFNVQQFTLTTSKTGSGQGTITGAGTYNYNQLVTVTASPDVGSTFTGFGGDCSGTTCSVRMTANHNVSATFNVQQFTLTTSKTGNGQGTITGAGTYNYNQLVTVTASPDVSSNFTGFGGDCSGNTCSVRMTANHNVTASFTLKRFTLTTSTTGTGGGTVTGAGTYDYGQPVTVTNSPDVGSTFAGWGGDCSGTTTCTVTMTANHNVSATFNVQQFTLTTSKTGNGQGTITGAGTYNYNQLVTVTASPDVGSTFTGFGGDCSGTTCSVRMTANRSVSAGFDLVPETLSVTNGGSGGTITTTPAGISCGAGNSGTCVKDYGYGTPVTLTPVPDVGHHLAVWAGACSGTPLTSPCTVTMNQAQSVTVRWAPDQYTFSLGFLGDSTGTVTVNGTAYNANTSFTVQYGQALTLTAQAAAGVPVVFWGWGGACAAQGTNTSCSLTVTGNTSVTAEFDVSSYRYTLNATTKDPNWLNYSVTYYANQSSQAECTSTPSPGHTCAGSLPRGFVAVLTAHAPVGFSFTWHNLPTWTGCDSVSANGLSCTITLLSTRTVSVSGDMSQ